MGGFPFFKGIRSSTVKTWLMALTAWEAVLCSPSRWTPSPSRSQVICSWRWTTAKAFNVTAI